MATYVNDLRLKEIGTGESSGTWGTETNVNLELIGEALSFGTEAITTNADTHTSTVADGSTDPARSMYIKYTGTLDSACTITIAPNTLSRLHFIENGTSGSQNIIISQGSGANVTIPPGDVKVVYLDGAGSGAAVVDAFASLNVVDLKVGDDLTFTSDSAVITFGADGDTTLTHTDGSGLTLNSTNKLMFNDASQFIQGSSATVLSLGATDEIDLTATAIDINGTIDVSGTSTLGGNTTILPSSDGDALIVGKSGGANLHVFSNDSAVLMTNASGAGSGRDGFQIQAGNVLTEIDTVAKISVSASEVAINDASADTDFRVESDARTHGFFVDGGTSAVSIGVAPRSDIHSTWAQLFLGEKGSLVSENLSSGGLFGMHVTDNMYVDSDTGAFAYITADEASRYSQEAGKHTFTSAVSGSAGAAVTAISRLEIDASGNVVFNEDSNDSDFRVESNGQTHMLFVDGGNDRVGINGDGTSARGGTNTVALVDVSGSGENYLELQGATDSTANALLFSDGSSGNYGQVGYDHSNDAMNFYTAANERGRFLSNGHFLVGTTTEYSGTSANLTVPLSIDISADDANLKTLFFSRNVAEGEIGGIAAKVTGFSTMGRINFVAENVSGGAQASSIRFKTTESATEREVARFGTDGVFLVNSTGAIGPGMIVARSDASTTGAFGAFNSNAGGSLMRFANAANNAVIGTITNNGNTAVAYNTTSDYRLKENINYTWEATSRLKQLKPAQFNFISDESNTLLDGFIAHEVSSVVPAAVTGEKDEVNEQGDPEYQGIDHSRLVPLLVKTIQELEARITALES